MSKKIIGVTVGTTINPQRIAEKIGNGVFLPTVTEKDEGKVLKAQKGQWVAEDDTADALSNLEIESLLKKFS